MYVRCAQCRSTLWFQANGVGTGPVRVACPGCSRRFDLDVERTLGPDSGEQYRRAAAYAERHGLDLPGAYSVLLGVMTVQQARVPTDEPPPIATAEIAVATSSGGSEIALDIDETFRPAIEQGYLTEAQARERGNRDSWAAKIARRHGLPPDCAYAVADGQITLRGAIAELRTVEEHPIEVHRRRLLASTSTLIKVAGIAVGLAFVMMAAELIRAPETDDTAAHRSVAVVAADPNVVVQRDARDRVIRIEGPDPESVIGAYCENAASAGRLEPIRVVETVPPSPGVRLGLFRDTDDEGRLYELRIRKDRGSVRWIAGKGSQPIATSPVPRTRSVLRSDSVGPDRV